MKIEANEMAAIKNTGNIGKQLLENGKINASQAETILLMQKESNMRFGEAAIKLGFITEKDIQDVLSNQFAYPYLVLGRSQVDTKVVAAYHPFDMRVEAIRSLRSQIMLRLVEGGHKSIALTSFDAGKATDLLAANLAVVFSQLGERTLLVDANLRAPFQHQLFGLDNRNGLSDILAGRSDLSVIHKVTEFRDLSVLSAGTLAPNPQELLSRDQFSDLVKRLANEYDIVIYNTTPL